MRFLKFLILAPLAALILVFAFANRDDVAINLDPFGLTGLAQKQAPMFFVLLVAVAVGAMAGGVTSWIGQGKHRRAARAAQAESARLRSELQTARLGGAPSLTRQD